MRNTLDEKTKMLIFKSFILCHFNYCSLVWHFCGTLCTKKIEKVQERALRFTFNDFESTYDELLQRANLHTLETDRVRKMMSEISKAVNLQAPKFMSDLFTLRESTYDLRGKHKLIVPCVKTTTYGLHSLSYYGPKIWNKLPDPLCDCQDTDKLKILLKTWVDYDCDCDYDEISFDEKFHVREGGEEKRGRGKER